MVFPIALSRSLYNVGAATENGHEWAVAHFTVCRMVPSEGFALMKETIAAEHSNGGGSVGTRQ